MAISKKNVMDKLKECYDPEIPINIVDLGLVYNVNVNKDKIFIKMTLTTVGCPMHSFITEEIKNNLSQIKGVKDIEVEMVWDPPWTPEMMSKEARTKIGI